MRTKMKTNTIQDSGSNYVHPIDTFIDSQGRLCDEFGIIDSRNDGLGLILDEGQRRMNAWNNAAKKDFLNIKNI